MIGYRRTLLAIMLLCLLCVLPAAGRREQPSKAISDLLLIRGTIVLTGKEPHTSLVIRSEKVRDDHVLVGEAVALLTAYQQEAVIVVGTIVTAAIGPGFPASLDVHFFRTPDRVWHDAGGRVILVPQDVASDAEILEFLGE